MIRSWRANRGTPCLSPPSCLASSTTSSATRSPMSWSTGSNQVNASYRSEFKDLFEVHFSRFDARLEQRWAQLDAKLEQRLAEVRAELDAKIDRLAAELRVTLERRLGEQTRWLFGAWAIVLASVIGLWFRQ